MAYLLNRGSQTITPESISRRRKAAETFLANSQGYEPISSWTQGAAKLASALVGGLNYRRADEEEAKGRSEASDAMNKIIAALSGGTDVGPMSTASPAGGMSAARNMEPTGPTRKPTTPDLPTLLNVAQNPFLSGPQGGIVSALLERQMKPLEQTKYGFMQSGNTIYRTNPDTGAVELAQNGPATNAERKIIENEYGEKFWADTLQPVEFGGRNQAFPPTPPTTVSGPGVTMTAGEQASPSGDKFKFRGNTLQAQALNYMLENGLPEADAVAMAISDENWRPLDDPEERARKGIDPGDKTPALIDTDGNWKFISGGASDGASATQLMKLQNERDGMAPDDPRIRIWDEAISRTAGGEKGLSVQTFPDGSSVITQGDVGAGDPGTVAYERGLGGYDAKAFGEIRDAGRGALSTIGTLTRMTQLVDDPNFYSGFAGPAVLGAKQLMASLGIDPNAAKSMEEFQGLTYKAALDRMGGSLGTGFSNADRDFIVQQGASLAATPEGNRMLIDVHRKIAERTIEIARMAREYAANHGGRLDYGFDTELEKWAEANPLFSDLTGATGSGEPEASQPPVEGARMAPDGKWYIDDPNRPGKYIEVTP